MSASNLETLKQELLYQKDLIETKGGTVTVANTNPSPSEISAGINSIEMPDFSATSATEEDVLEGKTFYSQDLFLKVGTMKKPYTDEAIQNMFLYEPNSEASEDQYFVKYPNNYTKIRDYAFNKNPNKIEITLPTSLTYFGAYCFNECPNFSFTNINDLEYVTNVETYALKGNKYIDLANLWPTLKTVGLRGLGETIKAGCNIKLPAINSLSSYAFAQDSTRVVINNIDFSNLQTDFSNFCFTLVKADCDFTPPEKVKALNPYCFYRGGFNNVTIPTTIKTVSDYAFGSSSSDSSETYTMKTFTFESETPPTIGNNIISTNYFKNGCRIYVPDTAVDTYKAVTKLASYVDYILPVSQKP